MAAKKVDIILSLFLHSLLAVVACKAEPDTDKDVIYEANFPKHAVGFVHDKVCGIPTHSIRIYFNEDNTTDTTNNLLRALNNCSLAPVIVKTYNIEATEAILEKKYTSVNVFILRNTDAKNLNKAVQLASRYVRGKHYSKYFVVYERVTGDVRRPLERMFKLWWQHKFADVIAILCRKSTMEMWTYNPFRPEVGLQAIDVNTPPKELFQDKFENLYGSPLRVSMFEAEVRAPLEKGGNGYLGIDGGMARLIGEVLNATVTYVTPKDNCTYGLIDQTNKSLSTGVINDVYSGIADVSFNSRFMNKLYLDHNVETTVSSDRDDLCIIVPTADEAPVFHNLFRTFSVTTWCTAIGSIVVAIVVVRLLEEAQARLNRQRNLDFEKDSTVNIFFTLFQTLMGDSLTRIPSSFVVRAFMSGWILYSFLLSSAFTGILITKLVVPKYRAEINTIQELHESELTIFVPHQYHTNINETLETTTCDLLLPQMRFVSDEAYARELKQNGTNAFVMKSHMADYTELSRINKQTGRLMYRKMRECLVYYPSVYIVQEGSPFLGKINELILKFNEYGFTKYFAARTEFEAELRGQIADEEEVEDSQQAAEEKIRALTIEHLQSAFYLFFLGCILSFLVFLAELVVHWYTEYRLSRVIILNAEAAAEYGYEPEKKCF